MADGTFLFLTGIGFKGETFPSEGVVIKAKDIWTAKQTFYKKFKNINVMDTQWHTEDSQDAFPTLDAAKKWARENVSDYAYYALEVKSPKGWLFAADVHH